MSLDLLDTQRATITVALDDGNGNLTPLGRNFDGRFDDSSICRYANDADGTTVWVEALAVGTTTGHVYKQGGDLPTTFTVTVTADPDPVVPGVPHLVVTFGTPVAK